MSGVEIVIGVAVVGLGVLLACIFAADFIERGADTEEDKATDRAALESIRGALEEAPKERRKVRALP